jgi:hypothetical protein
MVKHPTRTYMLVYVLPNLQQLTASVVVLVVRWAVVVALKRMRKGTGGSPVARLCLTDPPCFNHQITQGWVPPLSQEYCR